MSISEGEIRELVQRVLAQCGGMDLPGASCPGDRGFLIEASARHVHLTTQAVEALAPFERREFLVWLAQRLAQRSF